MNTTTPEYLLSAQGCERTICYGGHEDAVKQRASDGRWYITMGHPGFNSTANNANGYRTYATACAALERYAKRGNSKE